MEYTEETLDRINRYYDCLLMLCNNLPNNEPENYLEEFLDAKMFFKSLTKSQALKMFNLKLEKFMNEFDSKNIVINPHVKFINMVNLAYRPEEIQFDIDD